MKKPNAGKPTHGEITPSRPRHGEIPLEILRDTEEISCAHQQRLRAKLEAEMKAAEPILERARRKKRALINARDWGAIRDRMIHERAALRERMQPPGGVGRDYHDELKTLRRRLNAHLRSFGIPTEKVREAGREMLAELRFSGADRWRIPKKNLGTAVGLDKLRDLQGIADSGLFEDPHRFITFRPPFGAARWGFFRSIASAGADNFTFDRELAVDHTAGLTGHVVTGRISGASDYDIGRAIADTMVECWFKPPVAGLVEVLIEAQIGLGVHDFTATDESGISNSAIDQQNFLALSVLHPNVSGPSLAPMSRFPWDTDEDDRQTREHLVRGADLGAQLFSDGPLPAGQWVAVRVGTETNDWVGSNDMTVKSTSSFQWFIKAVHVRIAP